MLSTATLQVWTGSWQTFTLLQASVPYKNTSLERCILLDLSPASLFKHSSSRFVLWELDYILKIKYNNMSTDMLYNYVVVINIS